MRRCEECRLYPGPDRGPGYKYVLPDGQRITLCLSHAFVARLANRNYKPKAYGPETRAAEAERAIVGVEK